jgi:hypothetical protein
VRLEGHRGLTVPGVLGVACNHPSGGSKDTPEYQNRQPYGSGQRTNVPLVSLQEVKQAVSPNSKGQNDDNPREPEDNHVVHGPSMRPGQYRFARDEVTGSRRSTLALPSSPRSLIPRSTVGTGASHDQPSEFFRRREARWERVEVIRRFRPTRLTPRSYLQSGRSGRPEGNPTCQMKLMSPHHDWSWTSTS